MKTSTAVISGIAALALIGGGTAYALSTAGEPAPVETPAAVITETPTPSAEATPDAAETPTPVDTSEPTPEPSETTSPAPVETPTHTEGEAFLIRITQEDLPELSLTADQILEAASVVCATPNSPSTEPTPAFSGATQEQLVQFRVNAEYHVCD
jgi:hypothetical protein